MHVSTTGVFAIPAFDINYWRIGFTQTLAYQKQNYSGALCRERSFASINRYLFIYLLIHIWYSFLYQKNFPSYKISGSHHSFINSLCHKITFKMWSIYQFYEQHLGGATTKYIKFHYYRYCTVLSLYSNYIIFQCILNLN